MPYGTIKVDTVTFTDAGVDKSVSISGLVQNPTFSGNITVTGTVSGSVIQGGTLVSGATVTGTTANFTSGNFINISGGTYTITSGVFASGTAANPSVTFVGDTDTGLFASAANQVSITTSGTERLRVDAAGQIEAVSLGSASAPTYSWTTDPNSGLYSPGADQVAISTGGTGRLFITSAGKILIGTETNRTSANGVNAATQIEGTSGDTGSFSVIRNGGLPYFSFGRSGSASLGSNTIISNGEALGRISWSAADGTDMLSWAAHIEAQVDGTPGADDTPGRLIFATTSDGSNNATERMRLDSSGRLGLGTSTASSTLDIYGLQANTGATSASSPSGTLRLAYAGGDAINSFGSSIVFSQHWASGNPQQIAVGQITGVKTSGTGNYGGGLAFFTSNGSGNDLAERVRITAGGAVGIGNNAPGAGLDLKGSGTNGYIVSQGTSGNWLSFGGNFSDPVIGYVSTGALRFGTTTDAYLGGFTERCRLTSDGKWLVGTSSTAGNADAQTALIQTIGNSGANFQGGRINIGRAEFSANIASGEQLGGIYFSDAQSGTYGVIECVADGTGGSNDFPGRLVFSTTADGASSPTERMRIRETGQTNIYGSSTVFTSATNAGAGTTVAVYVGRHTASSTTTGTDSFIVWSNGNVVNTNNSYGAISDLKLKENIVDATSQWDDIKGLQVRKYNFKEGQTHTQIGLIAQEVELVSPGLVSESPDRDAEGNDLGTVTKSVNYSVLYMKAVKALQEAMERIETLEAKVAALEAA